MAYIPKLSDLDDNNEKYVPSLSDVNEEENVIENNNNKIKNIAKEYINQSPDLQAMAGFAQGVGNIIPGAANLGIKGVNALTGMNVPEYKGLHFAPDTLASKGGEAASYFLPFGGVSKGITKGLALIPEIANSLSKAKKTLGLYPGVSKVVNFLKVPAAGAAKGAIYSPEDQGLGAAVGAGGNVLGALTKTGSPVVNAVARSLLGGGIGYGVGGVKGAEIGVGAGLIAPKLLKEVGLSRKPAGYDYLKGQNPEIAEQKLSTARELGTRIRPSEAFNDPFLAQQEGRLSYTHEGSKAMVKEGMARIEEQKRAVNALLHKISPESKVAARDVRKASQNAIAEMERTRDEAVDQLYREAHEKRVAPTKVTQLEKSDKTIANAISGAMNEPAYSVELAGYPKNSIKVLDYAKRRIDSLISDAERKQDFDKVRVLNDSKKRLVKATDGFSPKYKLARQNYEKMSRPIDEVKNSQLGTISRSKDTTLHTISKKVFDPNQTDIEVLKNVREKVMKQDPKAWDNLVRNEIERLRGKSERGSDFFKNVVENNNLYNQFKEALAHKPKAVKMLEDIRSTWNNLINHETPRSAAGKSEIRMNKALESVEKIISMFKEMIGDKRTLKEIDFIHDPHWNKQFKEVMDYDLSKERRAKVLSDILAKALPGTVNANLSQGSDKNGTLIRASSKS